MNKKIQIGCSYFGNRHLEHFQNDIDSLKQSGFNTILLTYSENDFFFYSKTISKMVSIAKNNNFTVYIDPWGWGGLFGGEAFSKYVMEFDTLKQINQKGEKVPALCLNQEKTLNLLYNWIDSVGKMETDYVFWDEPHFYIKDFKKDNSDFGCFCNKCSYLYDKMFNEKLDIKNFNKKKFYHFKTISILTFLNKLFLYVKKNNKKNALCLLPGTENEKGGLFDWNRIPDLKELDLIGTDPYWLRMKKPVSYVFDYAKKIENIAKQNNFKSEIWIQGYKLKKKDLPELKIVIQELLNDKKFNFDSMMFWSYKMGYPMSTLESQNYNYLWNEIIKILKSLFDRC
jgi:hypothetical protein